jgi:hypothetical protein
MEVREHITRYEHSISSRLFVGLVQLGQFGGFSLPSGPGSADYPVGTAVWC